MIKVKTKIDKTINSATFLKGNFGKAVLLEYIWRNKEYFCCNPQLKVLTFYEDIVNGSNSYAAVLINQILNQRGLRIGNPTDLGRILKNNIQDLIGKSVDFALVLRNENEPNGYLAKDLIQQLVLQGRKIEMPIMIPLTSLELKIEEKAPHGLGFKLREKSRIIQSHILNEDTYFSLNDIDKATGLPYKTKNIGEGFLYTRNSGLSRMYLRVLPPKRYSERRYSSIAIHADLEGLSISDSNDRIIVMHKES